MSIWGKILFRTHSDFNGEIKVVEQFGHLRLIASGFTQSRSIKDGKSEFYWDQLVEGIPNLTKKAKVLLLGLGGGTLALLLRKRFPDVEIDGVEIDPLMIELGKKYFDLDSAKVDITVSDAAEFVKKAKESYDLICLDLFFGDKTPDFVFEDFFWKDIDRILKNEGVIVINKIYERKAEIEPFKEFISEKIAFSGELHSPGWSEPGNIIAYGRKK